jgi:hypothetical protein
MDAVGKKLPRATSFATSLGGPLDPFTEYSVMVGAPLIRLSLE